MDPQHIHSDHRRILNAIRYYLTLFLAFAETDYNEAHFENAFRDDLFHHLMHKMREED